MLCDFTPSPTPSVPTPLPQLNPTPLSVCPSISDPRMLSAPWDSHIISAPVTVPSLSLSQSTWLIPQDSSGSSVCGNARVSG